MSKDGSEGGARVHMGIAVAITVAIALVFGMFLGEWNFTCWAGFIVWAEYFAFGATPASAKMIFPSIPYGAAMGALWSAAALFLADALGWDSTAGQYAAHVITAFPFMYLLLELMNRVEVWGKASLATFNGLSLFLAINATGSFPQVGPVDNPYYCMFAAVAWTCVMAVFGWCLGFLTVTFTFPVKKES